MSTGGQRRASLPETVGAWLRVWTPPRDVDVPDVPVRKLLIGTALALVVVGVGAAIIVPRIDRRNERLAAEDARARAVLIKQRRLEAIAAQRPQTLRAPALEPAAGASTAEQVAARVALLARAETAISADARRRAASGELSGHPGAARCAHFPPDAPAPERGVSARKGYYDCFVPIDDIKGSSNNAAGQVGYPFRAVLDFRDYALTWCRTNLIPGEKVIPDPAFTTALPPACRVPRR